MKNSYSINSCIFLLLLFLQLPPFFIVCISWNQRTIDWRVTSSRWPHGGITYWRSMPGCLSRSPPPSTRTHSSPRTTDGKTSEPSLMQVKNVYSLSAWRSTSEMEWYFFPPDTVLMKKVDSELCFSVKVLKKLLDFDFF